MKATPPDRQSTTDYTLQASRMNAYLTNNDWHHCQFVSVQAHRQLPDGTWTKRSRWRWRQADAITRFSEAHNDTLVFCTIGHFEQKDKNSSQLSNLCFDFDCHDSHEFWLARNSCLNMIDYFGDYGLEKPHIRTWFSGGRSYHMEMPYQVFGIKPTVKLNLIMKHLAGHINGYLTTCDDCLEVDMSLYSNPRQFRLPNTYYPKYDAYKVEISWDELQTLNEPAIRDLAKSPRLPFHDLDSITFEPIPDAVDWYQEKLKEYETLQEQAQQRATPVKPKALKAMATSTATNQCQQAPNIPAGVPLCIVDLRQNGIKNVGDRNKATMLDASFCRDTGVPLANAQATITGWVQAIPPNMTSCPQGRERQAATNHTVQYIYSNGAYKFACRYAIGLGLTCNRENCPLWNKQAYQNWGKNVKVIPDFKPTPLPTQEHTVDKVRKMCAEEIAAYVIEPDGEQALFIRLLPGGGKTTTILMKMRELGARVLYAVSRHENINELQEARLIDRHIYPRDEEHCANCQLAAFYANKRYNVIQKLCSRNCEVGMDNCEYFKQFTPIQPGEHVGVVHEDIFIPTYMEQLLENTSDEDIPTVIIFDEPDPQKFFERVNITNNNITEAINCCKNPETRTLLTCIRAATEKLKQEERYIGSEAMERILGEIPKDTTLPKLLEEARIYSSIPDRYKAAKFDHRVTYSGKAWLLQFGNRQVWIPESACELVNDNVVMVEPWVIEQKGLTPLPSDNILPLNFLSDLVDCLSAEYEKYQAGNYNSQITIGRLPGLKAPIIRLLIPKPFAVPEHAKLVMLDGLGIPELLSVLTKREIETWTAPLHPEVEVIQITDGSYGITTLFDKAGKKPKRAYYRLAQLTNQIAEQSPSDTVIFTWKAIEEVIRQQQANGEFNTQVEIDHYGNLESKNTYNDKRTAILIGTPTPSPDDIIELANAIWVDSPPLDTERVKEDNWRAYQYADVQGNGYAVEVREFADARLNMLLHTYREQELIQAAHRIRPILSYGNRIILLANLPLNELPPTTVTTYKALSVEASEAFRAFTSIIENFIREYTGVWRRIIINKIWQNQNVINTNNILHSGFAKLPTGGTLQRWFYRATAKLDLVNTTLTCQRPDAGRGHVTLRVWHNGHLDVDKIRALYSQVTTME